MSVTLHSLPARVCAGVDWAQDDHAIAIIDSQGEVLERFAVNHDAAGLKSLVRRLLTAGVAEVGIERGDGPVVEALLAAELTVLVIAPGQLKNLRSRYGSAGNKDDRYDAYVLADVVRTDRHRLRPLVRDTTATTALRGTVRARRDLVEHRVATANRLRAHLQLVFPAATVLFAALDSPISLTFLQRFTIQGRLAHCTASGRLAEQGRLLRPCRARGFVSEDPPGDPRDYRPRSGGPRRHHLGLRRGPDRPEHRDRCPGREHRRASELPPDRHIFTSLPRSGMLRAARLLAEIGDARARLPTADSRATWPASPPRPASPARSRPSPSAGPQTTSSATPSATSPATRATQTPGPPIFTNAPEAADTTTPTPYASWAGPGQTSSGAAGRSFSPTTRTSTEPFNEYSTRPPNKPAKRVEVDTGQLMGPHSGFAHWGRPSRSRRVVTAWRGASRTPSPEIAWGGWCR